MTAHKHQAHFDNVVALRETDKALCCKLETHDRPIWFPLSHIDDDSEVWRVGDEGTLIVSEWLAAQKGLI
jgi:hypothetical protein